MIDEHAPVERLRRRWSCGGLRISPLAPQYLPPKAVPSVPDDARPSGALPRPPAAAALPRRRRSRPAPPHHPPSWTRLPCERGSTVGVGGRGAGQQLLLRGCDTAARRPGRRPEFRGGAAAAAAAAAGNRRGREYSSIPLLSSSPRLAPAVPPSSVNARHWCPGRAPRPAQLQASSGRCLDVPWTSIQPFPAAEGAGSGNDAGRFEHTEFSTVSQTQTGWLRWWALVLLSGRQAAVPRRRWRSGCCRVVGYVVAPPRKRRVGPVGWSARPPAHAPKPRRRRPPLPLPSPPPDSASSGGGGRRDGEGTTTEG